MNIVNLARRRRVAIAALLAAMAAGCGSGGWSTEPISDRDRVWLKYEQEDLRVLEVKALRPFDPPQHEEAAHEGPNLDAWKAGVLDKADEEMLDRMDRACRARVDRLKEEIKAGLQKLPAPEAGVKPIEVLDGVDCACRDRADRLKVIKAELARLPDPDAQVRLIEVCDRLDVELEKISLIEKCREALRGLGN